MHGERSVPGKFQMKCITDYPTQTLETGKQFILPHITDKNTELREGTCSP